MHGGDRRLERVGSEAARRDRTLDQADALRDVRAIPAAAILLLQQHHVARGGDTRLAPGVVQQHEREQSLHLGLRQQLGQQA